MNRTVPTQDVAGSQEGSLDDPDFYVRFKATRALEHLSQPEFLAASRKAIEDEHPLVRRLASDTLYRLRAKLSPAEAEDLEQRLKVDANDLAARVALIAFYYGKQDSASRSKALNHVLWLVQHRPEHPCTRHPVTAILFRREAGPACARATSLWIAHVKSTSDTRVLRNAVSFFRCTRQPLLALDAITKAQAIEPSNAAWKEELAYVYLDLRDGKPAELHRELASRILKELEEVCINEPMRERSLLPKRALVAHEAGDLDQARRLGQRLLDFVPHNSRIFPVYWQTRYYGHLILGRVSLAEGDLEAAKNHLAHSLEPPFEAHLKSFLPNMTLAKELLEKGAKDGVVQFLTLCAQHCPSRVHGQYWTWVNQIQKGEAPDFFGHLHNWS